MPQCLFRISSSVCIFVTLSVSLLILFSIFHFLEYVSSDRLVMVLDYYNGWQFYLYMTSFIWCENFLPKLTFHLIWQFCFKMCFCRIITSLCSLLISFLYNITLHICSFRVLRCKKNLQLRAYIWSLLASLLLATLLFWLGVESTCI